MCTRRWVRRGFSVLFGPGINKWYRNWLKRRKDDGVCGVGGEMAQVQRVSGEKRNTVRAAGAETNLF